MKKLLFLLMMPALCFSQKKQTVFIEYFVPISKDVKKKYFVFNHHVDYWKYCSKIYGNNSSSLTNSYFLSDDSKQILYNNIFNTAKSGNLVVLQTHWSNIQGPSPNGWIGNKQILTENEVKKSISYSSLRDSIDNEGNIVIDDNGDIILIDFSYECNIHDFIGINFYEEWTFDYKNLTIDKKILYYAPAIRAINPETLEIVGFKCPFIVENKNLKTKQIIAKDFYSNTDIFCNHETNNTWFKNYLEPSVKFPFIKEAMTNENNSYYECSPPYNKKISKIDALSFESYRDSINDDEPVVNDDGDIIKIKFLELHMQSDINSLGFVENWFFDEKNSSFSKEVNGVSFEGINFDNETHPLFLIKN